MKSKRMVYWVFLIPVFLIALIVIIVKLDTADNYISRAMAAKSMALALTDRETITSSQGENGSHFEPKVRETWYSKYIDYLLENGYLEEGKETDKDFGTEPLTYGEAAFAAEKVSPGLSKMLNISVKKYKKPIPKEDWWLFYESFLKKADPEQNVKRENLYLYGTPDNVKEAAAWTAYTNLGMMGFEGNALDSYIDHEIAVLYRDGEMIHMEADVSSEVTYRNIWLSATEDKTLNLYVGSIIREFPMSKGVEPGENGIADVTLSEGKIKKISLKRDTIEGKVLAVREDSIEIENYGTFKLDDDFRVYKTYGVVQEMKKKDILVGYDLQQFVVTGKRLCAALQNRTFAAQDIRVLVMNTDFTTVFHEEVRLKADTALHLKWEGSEETLEPGTEIVIKKDDERLKSGRVVIEPEDTQKRTAVLSIERSQGTPSYYGRMEISQEADGLILINELDIEDYLTKVVPSEMPPSYELEALKAQAVCARTYAYRQIKANAYSKYGAHVDDSTGYQVYNNTDSNERTDMAVKETYGEMVFVNDAPAETYYFSTSCGHTTDGTIWGANLSDVPYLKGVYLTDERQPRDLTTNDAFIPFIKGEGERTYDSSFAMYRWTTTFTNQELEQRIDGIGTIQSLEVTKRGTGGIAEAVKITGSKGEKLLKGQTEIRNVLGDKKLVYKKQDNKTLTGWSTLPSAFIEIEESEKKDGEETRTFTIWGGGYGHGVGMSQNGAQEMARQGKGYKEILTFFYDGVEVKEPDAAQPGTQ